MSERPEAICQADREESFTAAPAVDQSTAAARR